MEEGRGMGYQEWVGQPLLDLLMRELIEHSVVAAGYEDEFGPFQRIAQHAL